MNQRNLPSLTALRAFEAAARHLSVKTAAAELSVTATAVSHQIRLLEDQMGVTLFVRTPRQIILTEKGRHLLEGVGPALDAMAAAVTRARLQEARATVTLSTTPAVAARWLLPRVSQLRQSQPQMDLCVHISHDVVPLDGVTADVAIRYGDGNWPGFEVYPLFDNVFVPACSPALNLHSPQQLPGVTLLHFDPVGVMERPKGWAAWQMQAQVPALDPSRGITFTDETHTISAALAGQGIALMSRHLVQAELDCGALVQPFGPELRGQPYHLVYPVQRRNEPPIEAVREWLLQLC